LPRRRRENLHADDLTSVSSRTGMIGRGLGCYSDSPVRTEVQAAMAQVIEDKDIGGVDLT
jgi:hypothetical protein